MAKLIYIVSPSYSGSTLLDLVCGTIPGVFSLGELAFLPMVLFTDKKEDHPRGSDGWCSCQQKLTSCPVWSKILAALTKKVGYDVCQNPYRFQTDFLPRLRKHRFDMITRDLLPRILSNCTFTKYKMPWLVANRLIAAQHYSVSENSWLLYDTIAETCAVSHIVDSSKNPVRMNLLREARPSDISVIVLVRDIRGVAHSGKKRGKNPVVAARQWVRFYQRTLRILDHSKQDYLLVRYEDFTRNPPRERQRIATFIGKGDAGSLLEIDTHRQHLMGGNTMRLNLKGNYR